VANYTRERRNELIGELRAAGWSLRRIARHPHVNPSVGAVHAILNAEVDDDETGAAPQPETDKAAVGVGAIMDDIESEPCLPDGRLNPLASYWLRHLGTVWDGMPGCDDPVSQRRYRALRRKGMTSAKC
jgi:hypothetical protein